LGKFAELNDILVILKDHSGDPGADVNGDFDLSTKWIVIEYKDEVPQSVRIVFNADYGRFLTRTPKIKKRDRIFVRITEKDGTITEDVFHVRKIKKKRIQGVGLGLEVMCPHQSENHWKRTISFKKRGKRISGNKAIEISVADLNASKGSKDPTIEIPATFDQVKKLGNRFDENTTNNYFFESVKLESAIAEIKDIESQPIEGGGSFEPMYVRFKSKYNHVPPGVDLDTVVLQAFEQGFKDNSGVFNSTPSTTLVHPTIESGDRPNILSMNSDEDPEQGTNLVAIGDKTSGSFTREWMLYVGAKETFDSAKTYDNTANYKPGHLVKDDDALTYEAKINTTGNKPSSSPTQWVQRTFTKPAQWLTATSYTIHDLVRNNDIAYKALQTHTSSAGDEPGLDDTFWIRVSFAPTVDYSPLTKDKVQYWVNALGGGKHAATNNSKTAMIDPNVIIEDALHPRTFVRYVNTDPSLIPAELKVGGNIPDAFRMLVINPATGVETGAGDFAGNDPAGIAFAGKVAEFVDDDNDGTGFWRVFKGRTTAQDQEVYDWFESDSWVKEPCEGGTSYVDGAGVCVIGSRNANWVKGAYRLTEVLFVGKVGRFFSAGQFECVHSVKWDSGNSRVDMGNEKIIEELDSTTSAVFIKSAPLDTTRTFPFFVGLNFHAMHPFTSNAIPFGAVTIGEKIKHPTMDLNNMDLTHLLKSEWFGPGVEDYYPLQAILAWMKLSINDSVLGFFDQLDGDFKIGISLSDRNDNTMIIEYTHSRNSKVLPLEGLLSKLKPYQGVPGTSAFLAAQEPSGIVAFDPTEFLWGCIYTRDSFDNQGRYLGLRSRFLTKSEMKMSIDAWRWAKPLVATNVDEPNAKPDVNIEPQKYQKASIANYAQLKNFILGLAKFVNFDRRSITLEVANGIPVQFGDPVFLTDAESIDDADDSIANTFKGVADGITFSLSKPKNGPGGLKKFVRIVRRLYPT